MSSIEKPSDKSLQKVEKIPSSDTAGVLGFPIEGPLRSERYRLVVGMTDEDRAYRKQWLQDQLLAESEPMEVPGYYEARFNPIRRAVMWPLNQAFKPLYPVLGPDKAFLYRYITGRGLMALMGVMGTYYYFKYNAFSWESASGWRVYTSKDTLLPGDEGYGEKRATPKDDYGDFGYKKSILSL